MLSTLKAFESLYFTKDQIDFVFRVVSIVLHLGNLDIVEGKEGGRVGNMDLLGFICQLLHIKDANVLHTGVCFRSVTIRGETQVWQRKPKALVWRQKHSETERLTERLLFRTTEPSHSDC